jgi:erythronate-4-phosphate dehydrogenase
VAAVTILADESIPCAREAFTTLGDVRLMPGRQITSAHLRDIDLLIVRAITRVDRALLAGTRVRFVATATSGSDHIVAADLAALGATGYAALGCNANAVAEYMVTAWLALAKQRDCALTGLRVGMIGVGHVGALVAQKAEALGMVPVLNDPPKARSTGSPRYRPLAELLDCDVITCHTPLSYDGPDPTYRLIGEPFFSSVKPGTWFCNAGRGEIVDERALRQARSSGRIGEAVLDVWDREPQIDAATLRLADVATPHIAGYSFEGKMNGTTMVYEAACRHLGVEPSWDATSATASVVAPRIEVDAVGRGDIDVLAEIATAVFPIWRDDDALRQTAVQEADERGRVFDDLRRRYPTRREFRHAEVTVRGGSPALLATLHRLGFGTSHSPSN